LASNGVGQGVRQVQQGAKAARVVEAQQLAAVQVQVNVIVLAQRRIRRHHPQGPGHAQVDPQMQLPQIHQQVLGAPAQPDDAPVPQLGDPGVHRPAQARLAHGDGGEGAAGHMGLNAAPGRLHFGQFGHGLSWVRGAKIRPWIVTGTGNGDTLSW
jgi:hypothetical protein